MSAQFVGLSVKEDGGGDESPATKLVEVYEVADDIECL
jgi:hypothetical protein